MGRLLTRNDFLQRAHEVHEDKYDYTNTVYINNRHKIDVCCPIHGVFTQFANIHLQGKGCPKCAKEQNYKPIDGYVLDKDVLKPGNKVYSPENCAFIPVEINRAYERRKRNIIKKCPTGVVCNGKTFKAYITINSQKYDLGTFQTAQEAFDKYKFYKEEYIKSLAEKYKGKISKEVYRAMYRYKVT